MTEELAFLRQEIVRLTAAELDGPGVRAPFPCLTSLAGGMAFTRLRRLGRFWEAADGKPATTLGQATEDLLAGLYGQGRPWTALLQGRTAADGPRSETGVEVWFGAALDRAGLAALLAGPYADLRTDDGGAPDWPWLGGLGNAVRLTGEPCVRPARPPEIRTDRIEKLCRGLVRADWAYVVHAQPIRRTDVLAALNARADEILSVNARCLLRRSALGEQNRLGQQVVELLEAGRRRLVQGRAGGMWLARAWLLTADPAALACGAGLLLGAFSDVDSPAEPLRCVPCTREAAQEPRAAWLTTREAAALASPPHESYPGYEIVDVCRFGVEAPAAGAGPAVEVGAVRDRGAPTGGAFRVPLADLTRHVLIAGVTGAGKTNTCLRLLEQLAGRGVPFLIIESAKSEYRSLLASQRVAGLTVFTVGDETTSPLRLNPFEAPPGVLIQTHIDYLKSLFSAAFVLYPPMPYVLEQSLREVYQDRGWDLAHNVNERGPDSPRRFPTLNDLVAKVRAVVDRMGYDQRITMDVKAGLAARLDQLRMGGGKGPMLNTRRSVPASVLFGAPCLLELKQMIDDDEKAFLIGLILIRLYEHYESGQAAGAARAGGLRHVTLIEEAHRLLRNVSTEQGSEVAANPRGRAIEVFANILSEIRAYGEGVVIAEQVPVKLVPDAIKNTNLKVVHRLLAEDDRKAIGAAMNLSDAQMRRLATLRTGEAVAFAEGMREAARVDVPPSALKADPGAVSAAEVRDNPAVRAFWRDHAGLRLPHAGCGAGLCAHAGRSCGGAWASRSAGLTAAFRRLFNALRLAPEAAPEAFVEFARHCGRCQGPGLRPLSPYCAFVELAEAEVEARGQFAGWAFADVEEVLGRAVAAVAALAMQIEEGRTDAFETPEENRQALVERLDLLHDAASTPFAGCEACRRPCHLRFDMTVAPAAAHQEAFRDAFADPESTTERIALICRRAGAEAFPAELGSAAAFCFAARLLADVESCEDDQRLFAQRLADHLDGDEAN